MMGMNGVGSAGMTPEMVAYYQQQQQLLASNNGGTAGIPRFAPTQFGQVPPEFKPEDTNSAFWTPTLVGAGIGTVLGAGSGFQGYQQGVKTYLLTDAIEKKLPKVQHELRTNLNREKLAKYIASENNIRQEAIVKQLKTEQSKVPAGSPALTDEIITTIKGKSPQEIIDTLRQHGVNVADDYGSHLDSLAKTAVDEAKASGSLEKLKRITGEEVGQIVKSDSELKVRLKEQARVDVLDGHLQGKSVLNNAGKIDSKNLQEAEKAFVKNTLANADETLKNGAKGAGLKSGAIRGGAILGTAALIGTGIGLWNASQASSRNEDKATQLAALRQQEAGSAKPESMEQLLEQHYIGMDLADNGTLDGSAKKPQGFVPA